MILEFSIFVFMLVLAALILVYTLIVGISPMPTSPTVKAEMLAALPENLEGTVFELGSGWGTLAFPLAKRFPRCRVEAIELSPLPWLFSRLRHILDPLPNLVLHRGDFHKAPLGEAALVVCYIHPGGMEKLKPKLEAELLPGALVLCNTFAVPGWNPSSERVARDMYNSKVYLYRV